MKLFFLRDLVEGLRGGLMIFFLSFLGCSFDVGLRLVLVLAFWSVPSFGRESGLLPLWPKNEKQPIRNFTFYISVNDF